MKQRRLENICREMLTYVDEGCVIDEEQVLRLVESLAFYDGGEEKMPVSYVQLLNEISEKWQYRDIVQMSPEQVFVFGSLWGCLQMVEARRKHIVNDTFEQRQWNVLVSKYQDKNWLLKIIKQQPGIRHKDLAARGKKSPSQMTQLISSMVMDNLVTCNYAGREKFYFLSEQGERLHREIVLRNKAERAEKAFSKALSSDNAESLGKYLDLAVLKQGYRHSTIAQEYECLVSGNSNKPFWGCVNSLVEKM